jgi:hypothetical protein
LRVECCAYQFAAFYDECPWVQRPQHKGDECDEGVDGSVTTDVYEHKRGSSTEMKESTLLHQHVHTLKTDVRKRRTSFFNHVFGTV